MSSVNNPERQGLLPRNGEDSTTITYKQYGSFAKSSNAIESNDLEVVLDRSPEADVIPETTALGRNLGWSSAYILIISRVIGSGIFATPGAITKSVGSIGLSLLLWVVGGLISWFGLQVGLEYGCMLPRSGGDKVYLEFTYRKPRFLATTMVAVQIVFLGFTASNCIVFSEYVLFAFDQRGSMFVQKTLAVALLTSVVIIHGCFRKAGVATQNVLGYLKLAIILLMVLTSLFVVRLTSDYFWRGSVWDFGTISTALFKVFYSYAGLQNVNNVMNEVKNPVKTLKSAATMALLTAVILYLLINIAYFLVVPLDDIKSSGELIAALFFERVFGQRLGRTILPLAIALSAVGNVMVVTFSHLTNARARLNQEIARQGFLPYSHMFASSKPFNSPLGGLVLHYIPSVLVLTIPAKNVYSFILEVEGYPGQFFALATSFGLILLRRRRPDLERPYKAFLPVVWIRILLSIALITSPLIPKRGTTWKQHLETISYAFVGLGFFVFGVVYWFIWTRLLPRYGRYTLKERAGILDDGTVINRFVHVPKK